MTTGELSATTAGDQMRLRSSAENWATLQKVSLNPLTYTL